MCGRARVMRFLLALAAASLLCTPQAWSEVRLRLATTTSTENSGLLSVLLPPFEARFGWKVDVISVGTGKALELARRGDVDVVMVHAPEQEEVFVREGFGVNRRDLMHNLFLLVGPPSDPAGVKGASSAQAALAEIYKRRAPFVSRGDKSGTHVKEMALWKAAGLQPGGDWYKEAGQGMGAVLTMASELSAYTLTDSGTFYSMLPNLRLAEMVTDDPLLKNPYSVIAVNPGRHPHVRYVESMALIGFLTSPEGQRIIKDFKPTGRPLFFPDAIREP